MDVLHEGIVPFASPKPYTQDVQARSMTNRPASGHSLCKSAAYRDKSREWNVSKKKWNLCQLKELWRIARLGTQGPAARRTWILYTRVSPRSCWTRFRLLQILLLQICNRNTLTLKSGLLDFGVFLLQICGQIRKINSRNAPVYSNCL